MTNPFDHLERSSVSPWMEEKSSNLPPDPLVITVTNHPTSFPLEYVLDRIGIFHWRHFLAIFVGVILGSLNVLLALLLLVYPSPFNEQLVSTSSTSGSGTSGSSTMNITTTITTMMYEYLIGSRMSLLQGYRCFADVFMICTLLGTITSGGMTAISSSRRQPLQMIIIMSTLSSGFIFIVVNMSSSPVATIIGLTALHVCIGGALILSLLYLSDLINKSNLSIMIPSLLSGIAVVVFTTLYTIPPPLVDVPIFYLIIFLLLLMCSIILHHTLPDSPLCLLQSNREDTCWKALAILAGNDNKLAKILNVPNTDLLRLDRPAGNTRLVGVCEGESTADGTAEEQSGATTGDAADDGPPPYRPSTFFLLQKYIIHLSSDLVCNTHFRMTSISIILLCWLQSSANILDLSCGIMINGPLQLIAVITGFIVAIKLSRSTTTDHHQMIIDSQRSLKIITSILLVLHMIILLLVLNIENAHSPQLEVIRYIIEIFITIISTSMWGILGISTIYDIPHIHRPIILLLALLPCLPFAYYSTSIVSWLLHEPIYILLIVILLHTSSLSLAIKTHRNNSNHSAPA